VGLGDYGYAAAGWVNWFVRCGSLILSCHIPVVESLSGSPEFRSV